MKQNSLSVPKVMQETFDKIATLTEDFCLQHLNKEYADWSLELVAALARKRPSPLTHGNPDIWGYGVVYALGTVNFLFDRSQTPDLRADDPCAAFGISQSTGVNKAKFMRDALKMSQFDATWTLPSRMDDNPMI